VSILDYKKYRESELKHGRVAMLAVLGVVAGELFPVLFGDQITGPAIYQFQQADPILNAFTANVIGFTAAVEGYNIVKGWQGPGETKESVVAGLRSDYVNGDLKFDPLGLKPTDATALAAITSKELNNGRLAMIAIAGIVAQELVTGASIF
jgi:light-harvesting complex I chlorophyll a/b binding protein 1